MLNSAVVDTAYQREYTCGEQWLQQHITDEAKRNSLYLKEVWHTDDWLLLNDSNRHAFVLVAAAAHWDKLYNPVLAWSIENAYLQKPYQKDTVLMNYTEQLQQLSGEKGVDYSTLLPYHRQKEQCPQLLGMLRWAQGAPYNQDTPLNEHGKHTKIGCVPVATSQVLKYYAAKVNNGTSVHFKEADGKIYTFTFDSWQPNWESMQNHYKKNDTTATDVSSLMTMVGMGLNARYKENVTSSKLTQVKPLLCHNFNFSNTMKTVYEQPDSVLLALIYQDLDEGHPCIVAYKGHAFIADGYDGPFLHYNLGWGGVCNGWYQTVLSPKADTPKQCVLDHAVVGIVPGKAEEVSRNIELKKPGTLATLLTEDELCRITRLRIVGKINGEDLRWLRKMAGAFDAENMLDRRWGQLTDLDLNDATIVRGKEPYLIGPATGKWTSRMTMKVKIGRYSDSDTFIDRYELNKPMSEQEWKDFRSDIGEKQDGVNYTRDANGYVTAHYTTENDVVGYRMFYGCESLQRLVLPASTTLIRATSLGCCTMLRQLAIPAQVENVHKNAIYNCHSLEKVVLLNPKTNVVKPNYQYCSPVFKTVY